MFKRILQSMFTRLGISVINLLLLLISSRYLGVNSRGEISLFLFNIALLQVLSESVTGVHLVHFTKGHISFSIYRLGLQAILFVCLGGNLLFWYFGKLISGYEAETLVLSFLVLLNSFQCILLICAGKLRQYNFMSVVQPALLLVLLSIAIYVFKADTFRAYLYPLLFAFGIAVLLSGLRIWPMLEQGEKVQRLSIIKHGLYAQLAILMFLLVNRYSFYFFHDSAALGLYAAGSQISESVLLPVSAAVTVLLADRHSAEPYKSRLGSYLSLALWGMFCSAVLLLLLCLIPERLFLMILGSGFKGIGFILLLYGPAVLISAFNLVLMNSNISAGSAKRVVVSFLPGFAITLCLTPYLTIVYGIKGAALAALLAQLSHGIGLYLLTRIKTEPKV